MRGRAHRTVLLAAALLLSACDPGSPSRPTTSTGTALRTQCESVVQSMLDATQKYIDTLATTPSTTASPTAGAQPSAPSATDLQTQLKAASATLTRLGCDPNQTARSLDEKWSGLHAEGPVARAVLARLRTTLLSPASDIPTTTSLGVDGNLERVLAEAPEGSTIRLAQGTYRLDQSLVLLRGVTLRGDGRGTTVLLSSAADDGVLVLTGSAVTLRDLSVRHTGNARATVVSATAAAALTLDGVEISGGVQTKGVGGTGLLMAEQTGTDAASARTTTVTVRGSLFADNDAGGIVVAGRHRASISASTFARNGQCGVCFLGSSDGWVQSSILRGNEVGVAAADSARPIIRDNTITGGQVGIQVGGSAAATVERNTITGSQRAAMVYLDTSAGTVDANTCAQDKPGIVVVGDGPYPYVKQNDCAVATTR